jgi:ATP-dependent Clp protease adaptor protein ClpS
MATTAAPTTTKAPAPAKAPDRQDKDQREFGWNVMVWNDPITLMSYVVLVLRKLFGYDHATATRLMMQVHTEGHSVVATQPREQAEVSVAQLHSFGLQATLGKP